MTVLAMDDHRRVPCPSCGASKTVECQAIGENRILYEGHLARRAEARRAAEEAEEHRKRGGLRRVK